VHVGQLVREYRLEAGLSVAQLARRAELSEDHLRKIERGRIAYPRVDTLLAIASGLSVDHNLLVPELRPKEPEAVSPLDKGPQAGRAEEPRPSPHPDGNWTNVLDAQSAAWEAQLERGLYDYDSARNAELALFELWMTYRAYHQRLAVERCKAERPERLADLQAAEQRFKDVQQRLWDAIEEKAVEEAMRRSDIPDLTALRAEREAQKQRLEKVAGS
jgi:transcriptional regulator with XRE-family HTH domain